MDQQMKLGREQLDAVLQTGMPNEHHLPLLRWLTWLSLLSRDELARVLGMHPQKLWELLNELLTLKLIDYVILNETDWPRRHYRYHLTDLGLYALAAAHTPTLSARKIAMSYPVGYADLTERLARSRVHLPLSDLVTRLLSECPAGYQLCSYQQPYGQVYTDHENKNHTLRFDAAFLLQTPVQTPHAFYVHVDQPQHIMSQKEAKVFMKKLAALRQAMLLQEGRMPKLLLLSSPERFSFWAEHLERLALQRGTALLNGAIADARSLTKGAYAPIWVPFHKLPAQGGVVQESDLTDLLSLLGQPATPHIVARFAPSFSFREEDEAQTKKTRSLKRFVDLPLREEADKFTPLFTPQELTPAQRTQGSSYIQVTAEVLEMLSGEKDERLSIAAQLSLALSSFQKDILTYLTRHPYLTTADLSVLLSPALPNARALTRQIAPLIHLRFVRIARWRELGWENEERYQIREPGLRFVALRHGLSPAYYLHPYTPPGEERVVWLHKWAQMLSNKKEHTHGLYQCVRRIYQIANQKQTYQVAFWKGETDAYRECLDQISPETKVKVMPDAELLLCLHKDQFTPQPLLIEYDRATTTEGDYERKFRGYADYQLFTRTTLPPTLVITQHQNAERKIQNAINNVKAHDVRHIILLESQILQDGLEPILQRLRAWS